MLTNIVKDLMAEQTAGNDLAEQFIERIDAHIRDLETLKAWIKDRAAERSRAFDLLLGVDAPQVPAVVEAKEAPEKDQP